MLPVHGLYECKASSILRTKDSSTTIIRRLEISPTYSYINLLLFINRVPENNIGTSHIMQWDSRLCHQKQASCFLCIATMDRATFWYSWAHWIIRLIMHSFRILSLNIILFWNVPIYMSISFKLYYSKTHNHCYF